MTILCGNVYKYTYVKRRHACLWTRAPCVKPDRVRRANYLLSYTWPSLRRTRRGCLCNFQTTTISHRRPAYTWAHRVTYTHRVRRRCNLLAPVQHARTSRRFSSLLHISDRGEMDVRIWRVWSFSKLGLAQSHQGNASNIWNESGLMIKNRFYQLIILNNCTQNFISLWYPPIFSKVFENFM